MPTRDNKSNQRVINVADLTLTGNQADDSDVVDTSNYDMGVFFSAYLLETVGTTITAGNVVVTAYESDDEAFATSDELGDNQIIGSLPTISFDDDNDPSGSSSAPTVLHTFGVVSTKRYLRLNIDLNMINGTGTPGMRVIAHAIEKGEYNPQ